MKITVGELKRMIVEDSHDRAQYDAHPLDPRAVRLIDQLIEAAQSDDYVHEKK